MTKEIEQERDDVIKAFENCRIKPSCAIREIQEIMLEMKDGVHLRTILYRPDLREPGPVIVVRTCYPHRDAIYRAMAEEYCRRGFTYLYQYCRGTGGSEGEWEPNVNERSDGKETVDWINAQDWCSCMGYSGSSYLALTGWVIADIVPSKMKTMYLTHYGVHRHVSAYQDGLFRHDVLTAWTMENAGYPVTADYLESCRFLPHSKVDEQVWGKRIDWYREWIKNPDRSSDYWNQGFWGMLREIPKKVTIPLYVGEGWYDHHLASGIETYRSLSEESRQKSTFLIGGWDHQFRMKLQDKNGTEFRNSDVLREFDWFFRILVEKEEPGASIETYVIGGDWWIKRSSYDEPAGSEKILYIGQKEEGVYSLAEGKDSQTDSLTWEYDPENPVMTHGAESLLYTAQEQGSLLQRDPGFREDVISVISAPFEENVTICGQIELFLTVSTDVDDTALAAKIMEVTPEGKAYNIRTAVTTLAYREQNDERGTYTPGEKVQARLAAWDVAWELKKGCRLRVDLTSSDFPQYSIHTNYAGIWSDQENCRKAKINVFFGGDAESRVVLPVLPGTE